MSNAYTSRLVPETIIYTSDSLADGNYDFPLDNTIKPRTTNIIDYFYCVDASGVPIVATAGTVTIQGSSDGGKTWQDFIEGSFNAADAISPSRVKTNGVGVATHCRVTLSGVSASGAVGFTLMFTQIAGA